MKFISPRIFGIAALFLLSLAANNAFAQTSTASLVVQNNTGVQLNLQSQSCVFGTPPAPSVPPTIAAPIGSTGVVNAVSTLTSNGCQLTYRRSDNSRSCRFVATRIRSSLTGPWNFPTVNVTPSGSGISCTFTITGIDPNPLLGNWSVLLKVN